MKIVDTVQVEKKVGTVSRDSKLMVETKVEKVGGKDSKGNKDSENSWDCR